MSLLRIQNPPAKKRDCPPRKVPVSSALMSLLITVCKVFASITERLSVVICARGRIDLGIQCETACRRILSIPVGRLLQAHEVLANPVQIRKL